MTMKLFRMIIKLKKLPFIKRIAKYTDIKGFINQEMKL